VPVSSDKALAAVTASFVFWATFPLCIRTPNEDKISLAWYSCTFIVMFVCCKNRKQARITMENFSFVLLYLQHFVVFLYHFQNGFDISKNKVRFAAKLSRWKIPY
jgi:hypothetical protein